MKRQLLLSLAATLLALPALARDFQYTYEGQTLTYTVIDEEAKTCQVAGNTNVEGKVEIPEIAKDASNNYTVTAIGESAFYNCSGLTSVNIPNSVSKIGSSAFGHCSGLTSVAIPNLVTEIVSSTFSWCCALKSVIIPNSVTKIGLGAFAGCSSLILVNIPNSVTTIDYQAFYGCNGLTSVTIPKSATSIGGLAFGECSGLKEINVDSNNEYYESIDGVLFNKDCTRLLQYPGGRTETGYSIPNSVTEIGSWAFWYCSGLTSVIIPNSVTRLGIQVFLGCSGLTSVTYLGEEPVAGNNNIFDEVTYQKATLNYLRSAEEKIAATEPWSLFVNRIGRDADYKEEVAISEVQATDGGATAVYDMRGVKVGTSTSGLQRGIYIANGRKIFVR